MYDPSTSRTVYEVGLALGTQKSLRLIRAANKDRTSNRSLNRSVSLRSGTTHPRLKH